MPRNRRSQFCSLSKTKHEIVHEIMPKRVQNRSPSEARKSQIPVLFVEARKSQIPVLFAVQEQA